MPGYRTNTGGGLAGVGYDDCDGHVFGIGGGILSSSTNWNDLAGSTGNIRSGVIGAYGSTRYGALLIERGSRHLLVDQREPADRHPGCGTGNTGPIHRHIAHRAIHLCDSKIRIGSSPN